MNFLVLKSLNGICNLENGIKETYFDVELVCSLYFKKEISAFHFQNKGYNKVNKK